MLGFEFRSEPCLLEAACLLITICFCPKERVEWVLLELLKKKNKEGAVIIMCIVHAPGPLTAECVFNASRK